MIVSRGYAGVILIAIVFSTILTAFLVGERPDELIEVIRNDAPEMSSAADQKYGYAYTIVFRRDFDEVKVKFSWLRNVPMLTATGDTIGALLPNLLKMDTFGEMLSAFGAQPEETEQGVWPEGWPNGDELLLLDYSGPLGAGMKDQSELVHSIYLIVLKDGQISYYEGIADYFPEREWRFPYSQDPKPVRDPRASGTIEFGLDENRTKYVSAGEKRLFPELPTLDELPPYGELVFRDVKKDQRLTVLTFIYGRSLGYRSQKELIRVYIDGELEHIQVN